MQRVLLPLPIDPELLEVIRDVETPLRALREVADVDTSPISSQDELIERSKDAQVVCNPRLNLTRYREFLGKARQLGMIQTISVGYDGIDVEACTERGVVVCNVAEVMAESVAQHTWGLILAVSKHICGSDRAMREGGWLRNDRFGVELYGKTLGIIGLGDIGGRVALKGAAAFGMRVIAYDPYVLPAHAQLYGARLVTLPTLLKESDVVSIHAPLTPDTHHLLGAEQFKLLKPTAILVNTGRGPLIDEPALVEALERRAFFGAGLDVFEKEPPDPTGRLRQLDNLVMTSHIASLTREAFSKTWQGGIANVIRFVNFQKPHWIVNPEAALNRIAQHGPMVTIRDCVCAATLEEEV